MSKTTPWFSPSLRPALPGVYEVQLWNCGAYFEYFDGQQWFHGGRTPALAQMRYLMDRRSISRPLWLPWRGLSREPK